MPLFIESLLLSMEIWTGGRRYGRARRQTGKHYVFASPPITSGGSITTQTTRKKPGSLSEYSPYRIAKALSMFQLRPTSFILPTLSQLRHVTMGNETLAFVSCAVITPPDVRHMSVF